MPILNDSDFSKLANAAAKDLVNGKIPLNDSLEKLAERHSMNEHQITRLCESANNAAFNEIFAQKGKEGSADRSPDFDVASSGEILRRRFAKSGAVKTASAPQAFDPAWERRPLMSKADAQVKTAAAEPHSMGVQLEAEKTVADAMEKRAAARDGRLVAQALDELRMQKSAARFAYVDSLEKLYTHFRAMDRKGQFPGFEKDAMTLHGAVAEGPLDMVRKRLGLPAVTRDFSKVASRVVKNDKGGEYRMLEAAVSTLTKIANIDNTLRAHGVQV